MALNPNEIRDIIKLLEAGKPLPDEYRFKLFDDKREVELVWNGKTNEVTNVVLPFQTIEQVDEPRAEKTEDTKAQLALFNFDQRGRQIKGWTNKLIWGDNKLILSSLKNGPLREEIEANGEIKLIYIDPPFSAGIDYSIDVQIGEDSDEEKFTKEPSILEEFAYRNTWGNGGNTFLQMLFERISLMKDVLSEDGIIFIRIDYHWGHYVKAMLDQIFDKNNFQADIVVSRIKKNVTNQGRLSLPTSTDSLFVYFRSEKSGFTNIDKLLNEQKPGYWRAVDSAGVRSNPQRVIEDKTFSPPRGRHFTFTQERFDEMYQQGKIRLNPKSGKPEYWVEPKDHIALDTNWTDIPGYSFITGYPTENAEPLLKRVISISTKPGDLVADFFNGSGTTAAVAEKMGRKWIASDIGKFSINTTRKRMISVQRDLKKQGKDYRAFEILNLGKYERQLYVGMNPNLADDQKQQQLAKKESDFVALILGAYKAETASGFEHFEGKKNNRLVAIGPINLPVGRDFIHELLKEAIDKKLTKIDVLAFEFEMGLFPNIQEEAKDKGIDLGLKYIPRDVFDKRAIDKNQVIFHDVAFIEVKPLIKGKTIAIELTDFSVFYNQDTIANVESELKNGGSKILVENGKIIKVTKDKNGITERTILTKKWTDWIDYWSVDFDFENKKEIIRIKKEDSDDIEEVWTGDYIFENEWQSFRTKKDRSLELKSIFHECQKGKRKIAVKVVDIFGNDTMKVIEVNI